jgi:hypothetical protein
MVGILAGMLAGQAVAQGAPAATPHSSTQQNASPVAVQTLVANATIAIDPVAKTSRSTETEMNALPDAPAAAQLETSESASLTMTPEMKAMMDDASQVGQNLQSTPKAANHKVVQRPGMLVLGIAGVPLIVFGALVLGLKVGPKATGLRDGIGTAFLAPGAAMSGLGFYFAFHKKKN